MIYTDLFRAYGKANQRMLFKALFLIDGNLGFKYMFILRLLKYYLCTKRNFIEKLLIGSLLRKYKKMQYKYGIEIPATTSIDEVFLIPLTNGIVINGNKKRKDCSILQGVTIGNNIFKNVDEAAVIGDNVSISQEQRSLGDVRLVITLP